MEQPQDVVTGNPTVIKMLVNFYRHARGNNALRDSLGPALQDLLLDRSLSIRTDPLEVYRTWINQTESQTGTRRSGRGLRCYVVFLSVWLTASSTPHSPPPTAHYRTR